MSTEFETPSSIAVSVPEPIMSALKALRTAAYKQGTHSGATGDAPDSAAAFRRATQVIAAALSRPEPCGAVPDALRKAYDRVKSNIDSDTHAGLDSLISDLDTIAYQEIGKMLAAAPQPVPAPTATLAEVEGLIDAYGGSERWLREKQLASRPEFQSALDKRDAARAALSAAIALRRGDGDAVPAELVVLSDAATPGEWRVETDTTLVWGDCRVDEDGFVERMGVPVVEAQQARGWSKNGEPNGDRAQYNAALTAAAVNLLRARIASDRAGAESGEG